MGSIWTSKIFFLLGKLKAASEASTFIDHSELMADMLLVAENEAERERMKYLATAITQSSKRNASRYLGVSLGRQARRAGRIIQNIDDTQA